MLDMNIPRIIAYIVFNVACTAAFDYTDAVQFGLLFHLLWEVYGIYTRLGEQIKIMQRMGDNDRR